jgi:hypothetical protein
MTPKYFRINMRKLGGEDGGLGGEGGIDGGGSNGGKGVKCISGFKETISGDRCIFITSFSFNKTSGINPCL